MWIQICIIMFVMVVITIMSKNESVHITLQRWQSGWTHVQESSAKLTNQRVSYAFTSSPFSFHARHIFPTSKFRHSYSCILLIFYRHQWTACVRTESVSENTLHRFDASCSVTPVNKSITLISPVQAALHFTYSTSSDTFFAADSICIALQISEQFSPKARTATHWMPNSD